MERWALLASGKGRYSRGSTETALDTDLRAIREGEGAGEFLRLLERQVGSLEVVSSDFEGRNPRNPLFATCFLAVRARGARDWTSPLLLGMGHQGMPHGIEYHHIHPKATLGGRDPREINEIANYAFVSAETNRKIGKKPPSDYLPGFIQAYPGLLRDHAIPEDPELWKTENYPAFLAERRRLLAEAVTTLLGSVAKSEISSTVFQTPTDAG